MAVYRLLFLSLFGAAILAPLPSLALADQTDEAGALAAFEAVLAIHPRAPGARQRVEELRKRLRERGA